MSIHLGDMRDLAANSGYGILIDAFIDDYEELHKENDRLRAALEAIAPAQAGVTDERIYAFSEEWDIPYKKALGFVHALLAQSAPAQPAAGVNAPLLEAVRNAIEVLTVNGEAARDMGWEPEDVASMLGAAEALRNASESMQVEGDMHTKPAEGMHDASGARSVEAPSIPASLARRAVEAMSMVKFDAEWYAIKGELLAIARGVQAVSPAADPQRNQESK
jgi:hypothetical protein